VETCAKLLTSFDSWITKAKWDSQFDVKMDMYLDQVASASMRIFMGHPRASDLLDA